jgi:serine/threonine protein phosphatase PrpC
MKLLSGYAYDESRVLNPDAVLLQQAAFRGQPVLLACVCRGQGSEAESEQAAAVATKRLMEWFYDRGITLWDKQLRAAKVEQELYGIWEKIGGEADATTVPDSAGIFMLGQHFWLFHKGGCSAYLLNQRYGLPNVKKLTEGENSLRVRSGVLQENVGIVVCSPGFMEGLDRREIVGCLNLAEIGADWQVSRRLEELRRQQESGSSVGVMTKAGG